MKVLFTIHPFKSTISKSNGPIIFVRAWRNFLMGLSSTDFDGVEVSFTFVNAGFDKTFFDEAAHPFNTFFLDPKETGVWDPFDTHSCYWPIYHLNSQYDFIVRIDPDAFPTKQHVKNIIAFLKANPDTDFVSASNAPRSIEHDRTVLKHSDCRHVPMDQRKTWPWLPWRYPTQNGDMFIFRTRFFRFCLDLYLKNPKTAAACKNAGVPPLGSSVLSYGEVCEVLGAFPTAGTENVRLHIDGGVNSDFWAFMCSTGMEMAGVVDEEGRSFGARSHLGQYSRAMSFPHWKDVKDEWDVSFPHTKNIVAPYFHTGHGYLVGWYFDSSIDHQGNLPFIPALRSGALGFEAAHLSVIWLITQISKDSVVQKELDNRIAGIFHGLPEHEKSFHAFKEKVVEFYEPALTEYR